MISAYVMLFFAVGLGARVWRAINLLPEPPFKPEWAAKSHEHCLAGVYTALLMLLIGLWDILGGVNG